jgi:amidase
MLDEAIPSRLPDRLPDRLIVAVDAFAFAAPEVGAALQPMVEQLRTMVRETREEIMAPAGIVQWARAQRTLQPSEAWLTFKDWIERENPRFAYSVARNIFTGSQIPESERQWAQLVRHEARGRMRHLLAPGTILCLPTTPFPAPKRGEPLSAASAQRDRILCLCAHGGLTGLPQVSLPGAEVDGLPVGLSIVGGPGTDASVVAVAAAITRT